MFEGFVFFAAWGAMVLAGLRWRWGAVMTLGGGFIVACLAVALLVPRANIGQPSTFDQGDAFALCADLLRAVSAQRGRAEVPWAAPQLGGGEVAFSWPTGAGLKIVTGRGTLVEVSSHCAVNLADRAVVAMTVDGVTLK